MDDDWEQLAEKEEVVAPPTVPNANKWDGEDEEDEVKDNWEDEEEKKDEEKVEAKPKQKPKKTLQEKINERERQRIAEEERLEEERIENMTPEERIAEKLRLRKIQEEADLKAALETLGVNDAQTTSFSNSSIDAMNPTNKDEFSELAQAIGSKLASYKNTEEFPGFVEDLVRNVCANLCSADIRKIKVTVDTVHLEKQKIEKEKTKKAASKGKTKIKLRVEGDNIKSNSIADYSYGDDYDDFM